MRLYGTPTSPYVRRVRVLARELGLRCQLVDTRTEEGQAELKRHSPVWKVPVAVLEGQTVLDSHTITDVLVERHGFGPLRPVKDLVEERDFIHVVDGALDAGIRVFYAKRDGLPDDAPFLVRERARMASCMRWLDESLHGAFCTAEEGFGLAEIALATTLDWMRFREAFDVDGCSHLAAFAWAHKDRPSLAETMPSEG